MLPRCISALAVLAIGPASPGVVGAQESGADHDSIGSRSGTTVLAVSASWDVARPTPAAEPIAPPAAGAYSARLAPALREPWGESLREFMVAGAAIGVIGGLVYRVYLLSTCERCGPLAWRVILVPLSTVAGMGMGMAAGAGTWLVTRPIVAVVNRS